ncbi:MAG: hypothetical protein JWR43_1517 [Phenylobacterium sp.]|nr:hypothetical protein [Phenylobacterium sp.]
MGLTYSMMMAAVGRRGREGAEGARLGVMNFIALFLCQLQKLYFRSAMNVRCGNGWKRK